MVMFQPGEGLVRVLGWSFDDFHLALPRTEICDLVAARGILNAPNLPDSTPTKFEDSIIEAAIKDIDKEIGRRAVPKRWERD